MMTEQESVHWAKLLDNQQRMSDVPPNIPYGWQQACFNAKRDLLYEDMDTWQPIIYDDLHQEEHQQLADKSYVVIQDNTNKSVYFVHWELDQDNNPQWVYTQYHYDDRVARYRAVYVQNSLDDASTDVDRAYKELINAQDDERCKAAEVIHQVCQKEHNKSFSFWKYEKTFTSMTCHDRTRPYVPPENIQALRADFYKAIQTRAAHDLTKHINSQEKKMQETTNKTVHTDSQEQENTHERSWVNVNVDKKYVRTYNRQNKDGQIDKKMIILMPDNFRVNNTPLQDYKIVMFMKPWQEKQWRDENRDTITISFAHDRPVRLIHESQEPVEVANPWDFVKAYKNQQFVDAFISDRLSRNTQETHKDNSVQQILPSRELFNLIDSIQTKPELLGQLYMESNKLDTPQAMDNIRSILEKTNDYTGKQYSVHNVDQAAHILFAYMKVARQPRVQQHNQDAAQHDDKDDRSCKQL